MIFQHNAPLFLWQEAIAYACYLRNRTPTHSLNNITPYEAFWAKRPDIKAAHEFGSPCWVLVPDSRQTKLTPKSEKHTFVRIADNSAGWCYYDAGMQYILTSRNIIFPSKATESDGPSLEGEQLEPAPAAPAESAPAASATDTISAKPDPVTSSVIPPIAPTQPDKLEPSIPHATPVNTPSIEPSIPSTRRSQRSTTSRVDYRKYGNTGEVIPITAQAPGGEALLCFSAHVSSDQPTLAEARNSVDWPHWKAAQDTEIEQICAQNCYELVELAPRRTRFFSEARRGLLRNLLSGHAHQIFQSRVHHRRH